MNKHLVRSLLAITIMSLFINVHKTQGMPSIVIGMSREEVNLSFPLLTDEYILTQAGQINKGSKIIIDGTFEFTLVFNTQEKLIRIYTSDQSYRLPVGIGVGSSYLEVIQKYPNHRIFQAQGYGRYIEIDTGIRFGFVWKEGVEKIMSEDVVAWIEFNTL